MSSSFSSFEDMSNYVTDRYFTQHSFGRSVFEHVLHILSSSGLLNRIKCGDVMHNYVTQVQQI